MVFHRPGGLSASNVAIKPLPWRQRLARRRRCAGVDVSWNKSPRRSFFLQAVKAVQKTFGGKKTMSNLRLGVTSLVLACTIGAASAQTTAPAANDPARPATAANATEKPPLAGANSFTETQARDRIAEAGFKDVKSLKKDANGVWRGIASKGDSQVNVALDFRGNVVQE
jgi:hypothetical protein